MSTIWSVAYETKTIKLLSFMPMCFKLLARLDPIWTPTKFSIGFCLVLRNGGGVLLNAERLRKNEILVIEVWIG